MHFSAGAGLKFKGLIIDYAINNLWDESDFISSTNSIAVTYQF